jgi:hypothetical protein
MRQVESQLPFVGDASPTRARLTVRRARHGASLPKCRTAAAARQA